MYPPAFGHHYWAVIHITAKLYPDVPDENTRLRTELFLKGICEQLPCPGCGVHCKKYMADHPPNLESKSAIVKWSVDFHNDVNQRTGKRQLTYEEADKVIAKNYFDVNKWVELSLAERIRQEDHREIDSLRSKLSGSGRTYPTTVFDNTVITVIITSIVLLLLVSLVANWRMYRNLHTANGA